VLSFFRLGFYLFFNDPNAALVGPARPTYLDKTTDFWAQGFNLGMEFRF